MLHFDYFVYIDIASGLPLVLYLLVADIIRSRDVQVFAGGCTKLSSILRHLDLITPLWLTYSTIVKWLTGMIVTRWTKASNCIVHQKTVQL